LKENHQPQAMPLSKMPAPIWGIQKKKKKKKELTSELIDVSA
jgi:hypothetical protein